jgi:hypothetical protein
MHSGLLCCCRGCSGHERCRAPKGFRDEASIPATVSGPGAATAGKRDLAAAVYSSALVPHLNSSDICCESMAWLAICVLLMCMSVSIADLLRSSVRSCRSTIVSFADAPGRGAGRAVRPAVDSRRCARRHTAARCGGVRVRTMRRIAVTSTDAVFQHCGRSGRGQHSGRAE